MLERLGPSRRRIYALGCGAAAHREGCAQGTEVIVWDTDYAPRAVNPRHYHPAAITFHIISGTGVFQEEGKPSVTVKAGDSLFIPAGTTHAHWNPSHTEHLRFLEFIVGEKDKARPEARPQSN